MPRPLRNDAPGALHHVIARGNERKAVFRDDEDRLVFLSTIDRCHSRLGFEFLAYCLMTNHVHLAVRTGPQPLSRVALTILSAYAGHFNRRHRRVGHLFQGRYIARQIQGERHLLTVIRYIHRNPVAAGLVRTADRYRWSSDPLYRQGAQPGPSWLDRRTVFGILSRDNRDTAVPYRDLIDGDSEEHSKAPLHEKDGVRRLKRILPVERFAQAVSAATGEDVARLRSPTKARAACRARAITAILARDLARIPLSLTAAYFGRDESAMCRGVARFERQLTEDAEGGKLLRDLRGSLKELHG